MAELRAEGAGGVLSLRWADRPRPTGLAEEPSSVRLEGDGALALTLPGGRRAEADGVIELGLTGPLLWETPALDLVWEVDAGGPPLTLAHPDPKLRAALRDATGKGRVLAGVLDLDGRVGTLDLDLRRAGRRALRLRLEVFPSKMGFREDFDRMLADLGSHRLTDVLELLPATSVGRRLEGDRPRSLVERLQIFDQFFEPVERAVRQIARQAHTGLAAVARDRPTDRLRRPDAGTRSAARRGGGPQIAVHGVALPARLPDGHREATFDTPANRFVARALRSLAALVGRLRAQRGGAWDDPALRARLEARLGALRRLLALDFLRGLPDRAEAPDLVVQRAPGYRELLRSYRRALLGFSVVAGDVSMGLRDLWALYELWCAVRVEQELSRLLGPGQGRLRRGPADRDRDGEGVCFPDGTRLRAQARAADGSGHTPDLLLELQRPAPGGGDARFRLVLDAKYRLTFGVEQGRPFARPPQDALNAIHRYRDALVEHGPRGALRQVYGGVVLFPHPDERAFMADPRSAWAQFSTLGVGAVPLSPGQGDALRQWLGGVVRASEVALHGLGPPYPALPPRPRPGVVLLAPLEHGDAQLQQILDERWAHVRASPRRGAAGDSAALYRLDVHRPSHLAMAPKGAGSEVRWLWPILGWERVDDDQIAKQARFGEGGAGRSPPYLRLQLGPPERRDRPLRGDERGLRGLRYVPLEVFDLADSVFLLRGDARHAALLRVLRHLRQGAATWPEGWSADEPLIFDGRVLGRLQADAKGLRWSVGREHGIFRPEDLQLRAVGAVYDALRGKLEAAARGARS